MAATSPESQNAIALLFVRGEWQSARQIEKEARAQLTDAVQDFIEFAIAQGSEAADEWYWPHFTRITYEACSGVCPHWRDNRDAMDISELHLLSHVERNMVTGIRLCLQLKLPYKVAFQVVKQMAIAAASNPYPEKNRPATRRGTSVMTCNCTGIQYGRV